MLVPLVTAGLLWLGLPGGGNLWPLLFVALVPFLLTVLRPAAAPPGRLVAAEGLSLSGVAVCGVLTGLCHFLLLLYWIVIVLGRYGGLPLYLTIPALVLLAFYMSLYFGLFALAARLFAVHIPLPFSLWLMPAAWVALDWVRSFLFTGFPWMDPGYGLAHVPWLIQSAELWGHYGLTYLLLLINTLVALLILAGTKKKGQLGLIMPVILLCSIVALYSLLRWPQLERQMAASDSMHIGVVQGNIAQDEKWSPGLQQKTLENYIGQSQELTKEGRSVLVVWPETALPFYAVDHPLLPLVRDLAVQEQIALLTGAPWFKQPAASDQDMETSYYNSALLVDAGGRIADIYSKSHLVPFGEYVPLRTMLPFLAPLVEAVGDFSAGSIQQALTCQNARIGVLICFESIFPDIARQWVEAQANVLVNLTNDAWYGRSSAPHHSLAMAVLRSVETRRSMVRAANTGFSGFIDPLGRLQQVSPLFEPWAGSAEVVLMEEKTWFVRGGYLFAPFCLVLALVSVLWVVAFKPGLKQVKNPYINC